MHKASDATELLSLAPVIPVVVIEDAEAAPLLARALLTGGLRTVEVALRTPAALDAIRAIVAAVPEMVVGAGTVLSGEDLEAATKAGARYALAPVATPKLMRAAREGSIPFIPGVATSSEIMRGMALGYRHFKFFPAEQLGGVEALTAIAGPLPDARFCPTGSITPARAPDYLALDNVICVGGSWVAPADKIRARDWDSIAALAKQSVALRR